MTREKFRSLIKNKYRKYLQMSWSVIDRMLEKVIFPKDSTDSYGWKGAMHKGKCATFKFRLKDKSEKYYW